MAEGVALAKSARRTLLRIGLVLLGLVLLGVAWVVAMMPRAQAARVEAALEVVGVDTRPSFAWILKTAHGAALVDAGADVSGEAIRAELDAEHVPLEKVHTILLTHGHWDHFAAAHLFPNAKVYAGPGEADFLRGARRYGSSAQTLLGGFVERPPVPAHVQELHDGEKLDVDGEAIQVIHLPGHTPGSVAFLWSNLLFSGDALEGTNKGVKLQPRFFSDDWAQARESLRKLPGLPFTRMADGHAGVTADVRRKLREFLEER